MVAEPIPAWRRNHAAVGLDSRPERCYPFDMPTHSSRRDFLKSSALFSASAAGASAEPAGVLPQVKLGRYSISRLICGANPFNAGSHLSVFFNAELRRYFTPDQVLRTLRREIG